ncbi:hypothetical protein [Streptomyces achromogenes]|uniref:hypothetical protein n=1 Tax=Streptomyces achromogenes TaxID=67255 RepID=UPI00386487DE
MAARTGQSPGALSTAARGGQLPPLEVALAYAEACGGDRAEWEHRWRAAEAGLGTAPRGGAGGPSSPSPGPSRSP